jgi:tyrosyl-tRNA synthetase
MKIYTFMSLDEIAKFSSLSGEELNSAKEILAYEATKIVHGTIEADKAREAAKNIFSAGNIADAPGVEIPAGEVIGETVSALCVKAGLFSSKGEAKRMIEQGGLSMNGIKVTDPLKIIDNTDINKGLITLKKGKKVFLNIEIS